jgi:predicted PolB exonuclease-like 3'-5' exonuclease
MQNVLVWDLETVPDFGLMAEVQKTTIAKARELSKVEFPRLPFHKIVCIGAVVCSRSSIGWKIESIGAPSIAERSEAELVESFLNRVEELKPQLITFNGASFDFPVLRYRAMAHKIGSRIFQNKNYFNRYTEDAIDLCDVLASFDARSKASLDLTCRIMGLSGKSAGITGADVESYVSSGRIREVAEYCESDVVNTFRLWLRFELFRGTLSSIEFESSEENLRGFIQERLDSKPHLARLINSL